MGTDKYETKEKEKYGLSRKYNFISIKPCVTAYYAA